MAFRLLLAWSAGLAMLEVATLVLGMAHVSTSRAVAFAILVLACAAGAATWRLAQVDGSAEGGTSRLQIDAPPAKGEPKWMWAAPIVLALFVGPLYLALFISAWSKPELSFDGMTYHVPTIHFWSERGYVHWIEVDATANDWRGYITSLLDAYPKGGELVGFVFVRAAGSEQPVNVSTFAFLPLGVLGVTSIARALGAARPFALAAGLAYLLVPINIGQSVTTYVDAAYGSAVVAWLAAVVLAFDAIRNDSATWRTSLASGCTFGLTIATKASGVALAAVGFVALVGVCVVATRKSEPRSRARAFARAVLAPLVLGLAIGGYWYARNWMHESNPLYPVRVSVLGHTIFPGEPVEDVIAANGNTPPQYRELGPAGRVLEAWSQGVREGAWPSSTRFCDPREGGLGFLWLLGGVPSLVALLSRRARSPALILLATMTAVGFLATPMNWWSRYTVWIHAAGLGALALAVTEIARRREALVAKIFGGAWIAACFGLAGVEALTDTRWAATRACYLGKPRSIATASSAWAALTTHDGPSAFFDELAGHPLALRAASDQRTVAVTIASPYERNIVGVVGDAAGSRRVVLVDDAVLRDRDALDAFVSREDVAWIFYGEQLPSSEALAARARASERVDPYWVVYDVSR